MSSVRKRFTIFVAGIAATLAITLTTTATGLVEGTIVTSGSIGAHVDDTGWS
ncbi:hypothetical protein ABZ572_37900 [Streptomyces sp. NPDC018338]|uniref:hypothetical protein n=1 Tax=Streptomyces sp. NPDC018338 TaxID=3157192 RepID=UPI0033E7501E